ncbi:recombinase family protein [uncultured Bacteroides sp.]|uniref:recombinase family protein n=1 Tax=uncultured Bacteroides sp. TaxID=162156 RepID=UPI00272CC561|nr:recombinase family protein [uncultured Bacteroides sp.]
MEQKKAWIYCRVAHNGPDSAEILERQRHRLESYAKEHGFEIVGVSSDIGCGLTMDRPGLLDFHAAAEDGDTDILLIHSLTRLGRDTDKVTKYWHLLRNLGVSVHAADCGEIDLSLDTMLRGIIEDMRKHFR